MNNPKRKPGRPPKPEAEILVQRSIRLTAEQWRKVDSIGIGGLRKLIDRIKIYLTEP